MAIRKKHINLTSARRPSQPPASTKPNYTSPAKLPVKLATFPLFKKLPPELRMDIWDLVEASLPGRIIETGYNDTHRRFTSPTLPPPSVHICYESRHIALKKYQPFANTHVNWKKDTILLTNDFNHLGELLSEKFGMMFNDIQTTVLYENCQRLAMGSYMAKYYCDKMDPIAEATFAGPVKLEPGLFPQFQKLEVLNEIYSCRLSKDDGYLKIKTELHTELNPEDVLAETELKAVFNGRGKEKRLKGQAKRLKWSEIDKKRRDEKVKLLKLRRSARKMEGL